VIIHDSYIVFLWARPVLASVGSTLLGGVGSVFPVLAI